MSGIDAEGLTKRFGPVTALDGVSFSIRPGEIFGLLGPNGSGKTTTVRILGCLIKPTSGSARVAGYDIEAESLRVRASVGVLTENPGVYDRLTAVENLEFFAEAYGLSEHVARDTRIRELLEFFDLWDRRLDRVGTYSKGMRQKLAIAKAVVHRPSVVFLDEPSSGLDPRAAKDIRDLMERMSRQERHTVVLCTHNLEEAERLCSRVMIIRKGFALASGTMEDLRGMLRGKPALRVALESVPETLLGAAAGIVGVRAVRVDEGSLVLDLDDPEAGAPDVVKGLVEAGGRVRAVSVLRPTLEDAYLELTEASA